MPCGAPERNEALRPIVVAGSYRVGLVNTPLWYSRRWPFSWVIHFRKGAFEDQRNEPRDLFP
jgi:hypothetical protein